MPRFQQLPTSDLISIVSEQHPGARVVYRAGLYQVRVGNERLSGLHRDRKSAWEQAAKSVVEQMILVDT